MAIAGGALLPQMLEIRQPASRALFSGLIALQREHSKAMVDAVLLPLARQNAATLVSAQTEVTLTPHPCLNSVWSVQS